MIDPVPVRSVLADDPALRRWVPKAARWRSLQGGRTNDLWRVSADKGDLVVKRYHLAAASPLFPNDPLSEAAALRHLRGHGLAPECVALVETRHGTCLIYNHVNGTPGAVAPGVLGRGLSRLHRIAPPTELRRVASGSAAILAQGDRMLSDCATTADLWTLRPQCDVPAADPVFLHGDPVPGNVIATPGGPVLIDWQCPAIGDPVEDLGLALSPAMNHLYGAGPMDAAAQDALLDGYGDPATVRRYRALAPALHWRMAVYCLWRVANRGQNAQDRTALALEIAALKAAAQSSR